jgi:pilus assembly protein TadC
VADTILLSVLIAVLCSIVFFVLTNIFESIFAFISGSSLFIVLALIFAISSIVTAFIRYSLVYFSIDDRKIRCQEVLPDFLSVVAMNISAGMEPLAALYVSLRPDFNPITDELKKIRSLSLGSKSIVDQLALLKTRIESNSLKNAVSIIERASLSGGDLSVLLESVSGDIRETNKIQKELESATKGYVTFITFLALVGVPLLLSVSTLFLSIITVPTIAGGLTSMLSVNLQGKPIPVDQIQILFLVLIAFSSIAASFIFAVLWKGEMKQGIKYIPILVPISLIVFFVFKNTLKSVLGTFVGFGSF